ncbi:hypothetical protein EMIT0347P_20105 [Pseudomonas sp. IT-347P]
MHWQNSLAIEAIQREDSYRPHARFNQHFLFGGISLYISLYSESILASAQSPPTVAALCTSQ